MEGCQKKKKKEFSRWDPYLDLINQKLEIPGITIRGLHEFFRETMGDSQIPGTYESLKAYIRKKIFRLLALTDKLHMSILKHRLVSRFRWIG